jgi:hypothetical protein
MVRRAYSQRTLVEVLLRRVLNVHLAGIDHGRQAANRLARAGMGFRKSSVRIAPPRPSLDTVTRSGHRRQERRQIGDGDDLCPLRKDLVDERFLDFGIAVGAGVGEDEEAVVAVRPIANG